MPWVIWGSLWAGSVFCTRAAADPELRAYPDPLPEDVAYDTVVKSQSFPFMKYPVPIIGAKVHPEEVHVTPSGQLIFPREAVWRGLCVAALIGPADAAPALPSADGVIARLLDGYLPAIENQWVAGDLQLNQLAFAMAGSEYESTTGREPLIALVRYTLTNKSPSRRPVVLALQFGQAEPEMSVKRVPPVYPRVLSFVMPFIREEDGTYVACLLTKGLKSSFKRLVAAAQVDPAHYLLLNGKEETIKGPVYAVEIERHGDAIAVGQWQAPGGVDFYVESSKTHSVAIAIDVEAVGPDGAVKPVGKLYRTGFGPEDRPAADYVAPGQHSAALPWTELAKVLPQGKSKLVGRCFYPSGAGRKQVGSWEPIFCLARPGVLPRFKNFAPGAPGDNRLSFTLSLTAGASQMVDLAVAYFPLPEGSRGQLERLQVTEELARFRRYWVRELNRNAEFVVPENRIRDAYRACVANNLILTDRDPKSGVLQPHPDATSYEAVWAGDGAVSIQAMDRLGYHREAESMLDYFLARQGQAKPEGDVQSAEGFFSGDVDLKWMNQNGFILWAMAEHYKLTHDEPWLRRVAPQLVKGCNWIIRERARTKVLEKGEKPKHYGLLPKGRPSDLWMWDHWYWTDTYTYMGLRGTADVLAAIGQKEEASRLAAEADDYKACIVNSVERSTEKKLQPVFVPPSPYRTGPPSFAFFNEVWYSICSPIYMVEAGLLDPRSEKVAGLEHWLKKFGLYSGMPALGAGAIDPYYVYSQSLAQLLRGETAKFAWTLYSISAYAMGQGTYCTIEGHNLVTGFNTESWHANRQPHMHSNSRYVDLVRIALLLEEGNTLHLLPGAPRGWLADGQQIEVKRAPSYFGQVNFTARSRVDRGEILFEVEPPRWGTPQVVLHVRPPAKYGRLKVVTVNDQAWGNHDDEAVRLPRFETKARVVCTF